MSWTNCFSLGTLFLLEWLTVKRRLNVWQTFSQRWMSWAVTSRKTTDYICHPMIKWAFKWKLEFWQQPVSASQYLKPFRWDQWWYYSGHLILCTKIYQHLKELHDSASQYFSNDQGMMLQNHAWINDLFRTQEKPKDFLI